MVRRLRDAVDGGDDPADDLGPGDPPGRDRRRELYLTKTFEGLWDVRGSLDAVTGEKLASLLEALETPDGPDRAWDQRRTPAQRRHDALDGLCDRALAVADLPEVHRHRPQVVVMMDVATLVGCDSEVTISLRLRRAGPVHPDTARWLVREARLKVVQTMGPWRPVSVGRQQGTLPGWLRDVLQLLHATCRGPDCDLPATWADVHHTEPWGDGGHTSLDASIPACGKHHDLVHRDGWTVTHDPDTGICTWISPDGRMVRRTRPPPA